MRVFSKCILSVSAWTLTKNMVTKWPPHKEPWYERQKDKKVDKEQARNLKKKQDISIINNDKLT